MKGADLEFNMSIPENEKINDPCEYMSHLAQIHLPLDSWGFKESYRSKKDERLIFDSQWCRVKFVWSGWEMYTGNSIGIYYGRLHAPNDKTRLIWNKKECHCWHSLWGAGEVINFLDGLSPQEAVVQKGWPLALQRFQKSELGKLLEMQKRNQPEQLIQVHAVIWKNHGQTLFELFDLRRPELWEQYGEWLKEYYILNGKTEERDKQFGILIPSYQVC